MPQGGPLLLTQRLPSSQGLHAPGRSPAAHSAVDSESPFEVGVLSDAGPPGTTPDASSRVEVGVTSDAGPPGTTPDASSRVEVGVLSDAGQLVTSYQLRARSCISGIRADIPCHS
jgi:hypothetical protein